MEEYISEDNAVRVVDAYVDELNLFYLGFKRVNPKATGRPGYTSDSKAAGRFGKHDFLYQAQDNSYQCPGGQKMTYRFIELRP